MSEKEDKKSEYKRLFKRTYKKYKEVLDLLSQNKGVVVMSEDSKLYLYQALELRAEYKRILNTLESLEPKNNKSDNRWSGGDSNKELVEDVNLDEIKDAIKKYKFKIRKLNSAIQKANFETEVELDLTDGTETMNLMEALEYRSTLNAELNNKMGEVKDSAYAEVKHTDSRTIKREPEGEFIELLKEYENMILDFRELNRIIRKVSFEVEIDYADEEGTSIPL